MEAADTEALITFYETLYEQRPDSRMAQEFMVKHGLLEWDEAEKVNKKLLKGGGKSSGGGGSSSKSKAKANDDDDFQKSKSKGKGKAPAKKPSPKPSIPQEDSSDVRAAAYCLFFTALITLSRRARISRSLPVSRHRRNLTRSQRQSQRRGMGRRPRRRRSRRRSGSRSSPSRTRPTTRRTHQLRRRKRRRPLPPRPKRQPRPKRRVKRSEKSGACGLFYRAVCGVTTYLELIQLPLEQEKYKLSRAHCIVSFTRLTRP